MQLTLLQTIQQVARRLAQPVPTTVYGSSDKSVAQFMALLEEGLESLATRGAWQELRHECTFLTLGTEDQGTLDSIGQTPTETNGLAYILPDTLWDRTNQLKLVDQLDSADWQAMKAWVINGPRYQFMLRQRHFFVNPTPTAGWTWAFEYISEFPILDEAGGLVYQKTFDDDDNVILLPDSIVKLDLRWRWKKEKGLSYAQDFDDCEKLIANYLARSSSPGKKLCLDEAPSDARPAIVIPAGNWNL